MASGEYRALAEFRFLIRRYLNNSEKAAQSVGLDPQQYQGLLALRGLPDGQEPTIRALADRLQIRHHSAVGLTDGWRSEGCFGANGQKMTGGRCWYASRLEGKNCSVGWCERVARKCL